MTEAEGFSTLLETMAQLDFFTLVLPFVLSYIVFFLALKQVNLFSEDKHAALIAIISSFFTAQFIATNPFYQTFFIDYFGRITIGIVGIVGLMVLIGLFGWNQSNLRSPMGAFLIIAIVASAFITAGGFGPSQVDVGDYEMINVGAVLIDSGLIWLLLIAGVLAWTLKDEEDEGNSTGPSAKDRVEWLFGPTGG